MSLVIGIDQSYFADRYLAYIVHPFFIVCGTYWVQQLGCGPWGGFGLVCVAAIVTTFLASHLIRRIPFVRQCGW